MSNNKNDEIKIKLILLGDSEVGKTSIIKNFFNVGFDEEMVSTTSSGYEEKQYTIKGKTIKVRVWDTAGQERFNSITQSIYKGTDIVIFVYDMTNKESFERIKSHWYKQFIEICGEIKSKNIYLLILK